ncbi:MAG: tryptophan 2,3-dioxygenase [Flavobacteriales bacterium]|nr:tryptophan 2,3-dioxygenase [Flavobacteriales bacterium]
MSKRPDVHYSDYLQLDKILDAQHPESDKEGVEAHDEMLFIVTHQAYELWFKQVLYELNSVIDLLRTPEVNDNAPTMQMVVHRTERIITILRLLVDQINVMETMTSLDFLDFRDLLRPASGFQSVQWKELEARLGLRFEDRHGKGYYTSHLKEEDLKHVKHIEAKPSLLDLLNGWLERMPYLNSEAGWKTDSDNPVDHPFWKQYRSVYGSSLLDIEKTNLELFDNLLYGKSENPKRRLTAKACRSAMFIILYRGYPLLQMPYRFINGLLEIDELMATWRTRHMNMVRRMIGTRVGTGNSSGSSYLKSALDKHFIFCELAELNGLLLERRKLPELPDSVTGLLGFGGLNGTMIK